MNFVFGSEHTEVPGLKDPQGSLPVTLTRLEWANVVVGMAVAVQGVSIMQKRAFYHGDGDARGLGAQATELTRLCNVLSAAVTGKPALLEPDIMPRPKP